MVPKNSHLTLYKKREANGTKMKFVLASKLFHTNDIVNSFLYASKKKRPQYVMFKWEKRRAKE